MYTTSKELFRDVMDPSGGNHYYMYDHILMHMKMVKIEIYFIHKLFTH